MIDRKISGKIWVRFGAGRLLSPKQTFQMRWRSGVCNIYIYIEWVQNVANTKLPADRVKQGCLGLQSSLKVILGHLIHVCSTWTRWSPRTRMLTRMLMVQMSKHMVMQSRTIPFCNSLYLNSLVHVSLVTSLQCGVESVECGVWSVK